MAEMESETAAVALFKKVGFQEAGRIPGYGLKPDSGARIDAVFLYKALTD